MINWTGDVRQINVKLEGFKEEEVYLRLSFYYLCT